MDRVKMIKTLDEVQQTLQITKIEDRAVSTEEVAKMIKQLEKVLRAL